jgi:DNA replication protein DnaC
LTTTAETPCPDCRDTGWIVAEAEGGSIAKRCHCFLEKQARILFDRANIPKRYQKCSLANFEEKHHDSLRDALKIAKKFVEHYPAQDVGLLFIGPCGVGKTHLAVAILRELIQTKGARGLFYDFRELIRDIQNSYTPDSSVSESDILAPVFDSDLLVLDELGAKRSSAWVEETVFYIINNRYNRKKLTLFTSNFLDVDAEEDGRQPMFKKSGFFKQGDDTLVDRIGVRLRSRIYEMCKVVRMDGEDYRKIAKQASYRF